MLLEKDVVDAVTVRTLIHALTDTELIGIAGLNVVLESVVQCCCGLGAVGIRICHLALHVAGGLHVDGARECIWRHQSQISTYKGDEIITLFLRQVGVGLLLLNDVGQIHIGLDVTIAVGHLIVSHPIVHTLVLTGYLDAPTLLFAECGGKTQLTIYIIACSALQLYRQTLIVVGILGIHAYHTLKGIRAIEG